MFRGNVAILADELWFRRVLIFIVIVMTDSSGADPFVYEKVVTGFFAQYLLRTTDFSSSHELSPPFFFKIYILIGIRILSRYRSESHKYPNTHETLFLDLIS